MSESDFGINPMPEQAGRAIVMAQVDFARVLMPHMTVEGLDLVRARLRSLDVRQHAGRGNVAEARAVVLDACTRRLIELRPTMKDYYAPQLLLPEAPGDVPDDLGPDAIS